MISNLKISARKDAADCSDKKKAEKMKIKPSNGYVFGYVFYCVQGS